MVRIPVLWRAGRCWGLCRRRHLLNLNVHVRIPALEDGTQLLVERLRSRLQQQMRTGFGPLHLLFLKNYLLTTSFIVDPIKPVAIASPW